MANEDSLETQIAQWRTHVLRQPAVHPPDVDELESHLREQVAELTDAGLAVDEALLVAVKRLGALDAVSGEFARAHSERLWKQFVAEPTADGNQRPRPRTETVVVIALAIAAACAVKSPRCSVSISSLTTGSTHATSASSSCHC